MSAIVSPKNGIMDEVVSGGGINNSNSLSNSQSSNHLTIKKVAPSLPNSNKTVDNNSFFPPIKTPNQNHSNNSQIDAKMFQSYKMTTPFNNKSLAVSRQNIGASLQLSMSEKDKDIKSLSNEKQYLGTEPALSKAQDSELKEDSNFLISIEGSRINKNSILQQQSVQLLKLQKKSDSKRVKSLLNEEIMEEQQQQQSKFRQKQNITSNVIQIKQKKLQSYKINDAENSRNGKVTNQLNDNQSQETLELEGLLQMKKLEIRNKNANHTNRVGAASLTKQTKQVINNNMNEALQKWQEQRLMNRYGSVAVSLSSASSKGDLIKQQSKLMAQCLIINKHNEDQNRELIVPKQQQQLSSSSQNKNQEKKQISSYQDILKQFNI